MSREARCRCRQVGEGLGAQQAELDCSGQAAHQPWKPVGEEQEEVEVDHIFCKKKNWKTQCEPPLSGGTSRRRGRVDPREARPPPPPEFPWKFSFAIFSPLFF